MAFETIRGDRSGRILVELDYNNIILVDPNKTISDGVISERLVDHEDMVMFANLEAELLPRTKLAIGASPDNIQIVEIAKINFLKQKNGKDFTTQYYDELTGLRTTKGQGINQQRREYIPPIGGEKGYSTLQSTVDGKDGSIDTGLLGITNINIRISSSFIPEVDIYLEDVQGRALFQLGEDSPYSAFFHLPYPPFYLTLKGYYGQAIKYQLNLESFNASFNSFSGNYQIILKLKGYKFNILSEISLGHLLALPHMYSSRFDISNSPGSQPTSQTLQNSASQQSVSAPNATNSKNAVVQQMVVEKGYQKILEVYAEYKQKGLIDKKFPELTLQQLMNRLELFEQNVIEGYEPKSDVEALTNIRKYKENLDKLNGAVVTSNTSFFTKYINPKALIIKQTGQSFYVFKKEIDNQKVPELVTKLESDIKKYVDLLDSNPTLGKDGTNSITNTISINNITGTTAADDVDWYKTTQQYGFYTPNEAQIKKVQEEFRYIFDGSTLPGNPVKEVTNSLVGPLPPPGEVFITEVNKKNNTDLLKQRFFFFDGAGRFNIQIQDMLAQTNKILQEYEKKITDDLAKKIEDPNIGLGFAPTVRNIVGVIMASSEAFIRLIDDVHTKAWDVKYDPIRKSAVLTNNIGSDTKNVVSTANVASDTSTGQIPVYPWPQVFQETNDDKKGKYQIVYVGDPKIINQTKGYLYDKWPEVEFIEEYLKGLEQRFSAPSSPTPSSAEQFTSFLNINAIEFPNDNIAYANKEEVKFFYEIWERQFVTSRYEGLARFKNKNAELNNIIDLIVDVETKNMIQGIGQSNPYLNSKLKNSTFTSTNYVNFFKNIAPANSSPSYIKFIQDQFITTYLQSLTDNSFSLLTTSNVGKIPTTKLDSTKLETIIKSTQTNEPNITDYYPFTNSQWSSSNLLDYSKSSGNLIYNTNKSLKIYQARNIISNFTDLNDYISNRPVTNFSYINSQYPLSNSNVTLSTDQSGFLPNFYYNRAPKGFIPTEGYVYHTVPTNSTSIITYPINNLLPVVTTTSIFNTPFFVNSILQGVSKNKNNEENPFRAAAYLFINSLPLASLKERYKTKDTNLDELDYIASTLKKFGGIHKLPYSWILKIGSVWHRYKNYIETGQDILDSNTIWKDIDYKNLYDPASGNTNRDYLLTINGVTGKTIQLENSTATEQKVQSGFFPKVYNDFYNFLTGNDLFTDYSTADIQNQLNTKLKLYNFTQSNLNLSKDNLICNNTTWSALVSEDTNNYFVLPSFGGQVNEVINSISQNGSIVSGVNFTGNTSIYNGSVRCFWSAPNYGYFDVSQTKKPNYDEYFNVIEGTADNLSPFKISNKTNYSKIEEIFSVFESDILDSFENEFLSFSNAQTKMAVKNNSTLKFDETLGEKYVEYRNFQLLFRKLMRVQSPANSTSVETLFLDTIFNQFTNFKQVILQFLDYDVIFRYGNPSNYNRLKFDNFLLYDPASNAPAQNNTTSGVTLSVNLAKRYQPYVANSLPSTSNNTTNSLVNSKITNSVAWTALQKHIGFSTIAELQYKNNGSYITDFFIDNNIEFNEQNVKELSPIIKMYATQKLQDPKITNTKFKSKISEYLNICDNLQNNIIDNLLSKVRKELPNYSEVPEGQVQSKLDGDQTKVQLWEIFKALNDKWIAGGDFKSKTFFEDFLFLDRASRNIGDVIYLDIFDLKSMLSKKSITLQQDVQTFIEGILRKNNFTVMNLPAYVNFYNVQNVDGLQIAKPDGSLDFADNMWGTFLNVDYRNSGPKMVAFYVGKPANYLDMDKSKNFLFRNDSFQLERNDNPLVEDWTNKKDWGLSNRCVGFVVDIGIRNQNVFNSFSISQSPGKATAESLDTLYTMIQQATGRDVATQNVSLWNYYNNRSYGCEVQCLGNALLQPTMYFNLRHVPMFNGAYFITDVTHNITPGDFKTSFTGTRQSLFDLPAIDSFLQSINRNLLTQIEKSVLKRNQDNKQTSNTSGAQAGTISVNPDVSKAPENSCSANTFYTQTQRYISEQATETSINQKDFADAIKSVTTDEFLQSVIYSMCYSKTFKSNAFKSFNNNFVTYSLDKKLSPEPKKKTYCCVNVDEVGKTVSKPLAMFDSVNEFIVFMRDRLVSRIDQIRRIGLYEYFVNYWPEQQSLNWNQIKNIEPFNTIRTNLENGLKSAKSAGINVDLNKSTEIILGLNTTSQPPQPTPSATPPQPTPSATPRPQSSQPVFSSKTDVDLVSRNFEDFVLNILPQYTTFTINELATKMTVSIVRGNQTLQVINLNRTDLSSYNIFTFQPSSGLGTKGIYIGQNDLTDILEDYATVNYQSTGTLALFNLVVEATDRTTFYKESFSFSFRF